MLDVSCRSLGAGDQPVAAVGRPTTGRSLGAWPCRGRPGASLASPVADWAWCAAGWAWRAAGRPGLAAAGPQWPLPRL